MLLRTTSMRLFTIGHGTRPLDELVAVPAAAEARAGRLYLYGEPVT